MPEVTCARISLSEGRFISHNSEYLRIRRRVTIPEHTYPSIPAMLTRPLWRKGLPIVGMIFILQNLML